MRARAVAAQLAAAPFSPRELLVRHVEFAARFGAPAALRPLSADMSTMAYHNVDLIAVVAFASVGALALLAKMTALLARRAAAMMGKAKKE